VKGEANPGPCRGRPCACPASGNHKGCPYPHITGGVFMKWTSSPRWAAPVVSMMSTLQLAPSHGRVYTVVKQCINGAHVR